MKKQLRNTKTARGSATLEAAVLIPVFLFLMAGAVNAGISICQEAEAQTEDQDLETLWAVDEFYLIQAAKEVITTK